MEQHLQYELQKVFTKNNAKWKNPPFSDDLKKSQIDTIIARAVRQSMTYKKLVGKACSYCERPSRYISKTSEGYECSYCSTISPVKTKQEIDEILHKKHKTKVFDWQNPSKEKDTILSTYDSVKYYKGILRAGMMSIDPHNGYVKSWVGGPNFKHFKYDMVKKGTRQVGSTFKPFVYATALESGIVDPCYEVPDIEYCIEVPHTETRNKLWCPKNSGSSFTGEPTTIFCIS